LKTANSEDKCIRISLFSPPFPRTGRKLIVRKDQQLLEEKVREVWWSEGDKWTKEGGRMMYT
jgi:hypothetical protein